jgi:hypothetical protein
MSMSQDSQDFTSLRRLLALKRYEQPPPGYFNHFSTQVIARIKAGEGAHESALGSLFWEAPWLQRLWAALETKPILASAFGAAVCVLLIGGVVYSERADNQPTLSALPTASATAVVLANNGAGAGAAAPVKFVRFPESGLVSDSMSPSTGVEGIFGLVQKPTPSFTTFTVPAN